MGHVRRADGEGGWQGCVPRAYASGARRHVLAGAADGATQVELRVFEVPEGTPTALEAHAHEHAILLLAGRARVLLGDEEHEVAAGDHVFVAAWERHRLVALGPGPLRFVCTAPVGRRGPPAAR